MTVLQRQAGTAEAPDRPNAMSRLRGWARERGLRPMLWLAAPSVVFMLVFFIYPLCYGVGLSFQGAGGVFATYQRFFADPYLRNSMWITLEISLPAALFNVLASVPVAYRMRGRFRGKRIFTAVMLVPITLGAVFVAEGMLDFLGPNGWLNRLLRLVGLPSVVLIHNFAGVLLSMIISGLPFAFLLIVNYFSGIDPSLEQAAAILGARPWQRFRKIIFPLLLPGLTITFCLSFVMAFAVFPSATLVGDPAGATHVISIVAYQAAYQDVDYPFASAVSVIMAVVELIVLALVLLARSRVYRGPTSGGKG